MNTYFLTINFYGLRFTFYYGLGFTILRFTWCFSLNNASLAGHARLVSDTVPYLPDMTWAVSETSIRDRNRGELSYRELNGYATRPVQACKKCPT